MRDQGGLGLHIVDAIDDRVGAFEQACAIVGIEKSVDRLDPARGRNEADARGHRLDLGAAELGLDRMDLAIDVRFGNHIEVDQAQRADPGARQGFGHP